MCLDSEVSPVGLSGASQAHRIAGLESWAKNELPSLCAVRECFPLTFQDAGRLRGVSSYGTNLGLPASRVLEPMRLNIAILSCGENRNVSSK